VSRKAKFPGHVLGGSKKRGKRASWLRAADALAVARETPEVFNDVRFFRSEKHSVTFISWSNGKERHVLAR
jgi:hypothetical protein